VFRVDAIGFCGIVDVFGGAETLVEIQYRPEGIGCPALSRNRHRT
jgi:hypothetical protein